MDYFELFDIPVSFLIDAGLLKKKFYELSRKHHPDFHTRLSDEEQAENLEKAALLNKAFRTFGDADETIKYVLQLKGALEENEKYKLPNAFLTEVMELNEELLEAKMDNDNVKSTGIKQSIANLKIEIYEAVKDILENNKGGAVTQKELLQVKEYYFKKKYLDRMLE